MGDTSKCPDRIVHIFIAFSCFILLSASNASALSDASGFMDFQSYREELRSGVEKISPGVVLIIAYDITGKESGSGSGFFIDGEGRILSNALSLRDAYSAEVFSESRHYTEVQVLNRDETLDLALLRVNAKNEVPLEFDLASGMRKGDRVIVVGKSRTLARTISEGSVSSVHDIGNMTEIAHLEIARPVLSLKPSADGPLLNMSGKVVGISTTKTFHDLSRMLPPWISYEQNLNAIDAGSVNRFLSGKQIKGELLHYPKSRVWARWFMWKLKSLALEGFVRLYQIGFTKIIAVFLGITLLISLVQWVVRKLKRT